MDREDKNQPPVWMKWLPLVALIIGIFALTFQITVLYPWHEELSKQFAKQCVCRK